MKLAVLYKNMPLVKGTSAFKPVKAVMGDYDAESKTFVDYDGKIYKYLNDAKDSKNASELFFGFPSDGEFDFGENGQQYIDAYYKMFEDKICIGFFEDEDVNVLLFSRDNVATLNKPDDEELTPNELIVVNAMREYNELLDKCSKSEYVDIETKDKLVYNLQEWLKFITKKGKINGVSYNEVSKDIFELAQSEFSSYYVAFRNYLPECVVKSPSTDGKETHVDICLPSVVLPKNDISPFGKYSLDDLYKKITSSVVNQDEQVMQVITCLYKRLLQLSLPEELRGQFGMLITGSTGVGKTETFKTFSSLVDLPILKIDSTQLTKPGYVGKNIEDYLKELWAQEHGNMDRIEHAIVIFDEIDKKASEKSSITSDVAGKAVQDILLKFMDGTNYTFKMKNGLVETEISINTNNMTVISLGAFTELYKDKEDKKVGFNNENIVRKVKKASIKDFTDFGMSDEFMGRHPIVIHFNDLDVESLENILRNSNRSPLLYQEAVYKKLGVKVDFTDDYIKEAAKKAFEYKSGARALTKVVEETTFLPIVDIARDRNKFNELDFTSEVFENPKKYTLKRR